MAWKLHEFELSWRTVASVLNPGQVSNLINYLLSFIHIFQVFRSGRISSVYIVGWLVGWLLVGHTFSKFVYFECCSVVMMVY